MESAPPLPVTLALDEGQGRVSALIERPAGAWALFIMGHGAGAGMRHVFMSDVARNLALHGIATLRYQIP